MRIESGIFVACKTPREWNEALKVFIDNNKTYRGECSLIKCKGYNHYKEEMEKHGCYCMAWSERLGWSHCHYSYYSSHGYEQIPISSLDEFLLKIDSIRQIKRKPKTLKWKDLKNKYFKMMLTPEIAKLANLPIVEENGIWWLEVNKNTNSIKGANEE